MNEKRTVYVVLALELNVPSATTCEEIDDILNETEFAVHNCPVLANSYVAENQFNYHD